MFYVYKKSSFFRNGCVGEQFAARSGPCGRRDVAAYRHGRHVILSAAALPTSQCLVGLARPSAHALDRSITQYFISGVSASTRLAGLFGKFSGTSCSPLHVAPHFGSLGKS